MKPQNIFKKLITGIMSLSLVMVSTLAPGLAASHSEAPLISMDRFADNTDVYAFRSIEPGREGFVTLIANYIPFQEPSGGPQYFRWDDTVLYEIKIDNTGDGREDLTYQFQFKTETVNDMSITGMSAANQNAVIESLNDPDYNQFQTYSVMRLRNEFGNRSRRPRERTLATGLRTPPNNIGFRTTPNYEANLGSQAVHDLSNGGKVFAGQRDEYFYIDLGGIFDTLNIRDIDESGGLDTTQGFNVSTIALEVPIDELTRTRTVPANPTDSDAVIGVWATASRRSLRVLGDNNVRTESGDWKQVSRLGNPLVNELIVPLKLKDKFNGLKPVDDAIIAPFVADPELPRYLQEVLFPFDLPPVPRNDLVQIFATGIPVNTITGPNYTTFLSDGTPHEYLRLNVAIPPTPVSSIDRLGLLGGDVAGFPNGRRVHDDVVDIALRAAVGGTPFTPDTNIPPNNILGDGIGFNPEGPLLDRFPYLRAPNPGNEPRTSNQTLTGAPSRQMINGGDVKNLYRIRNKSKN